MSPPRSRLVSTAVPRSSRGTRWLITVHLLGTAVSLAFPLAVFARAPGHFMTRLLSWPQLLEEAPPVVVAVFLFVVGLGLLGRAAWVRAIAMGGYWFVTLAGTLAFGVGGVLLVGSQMSPPLRPFGLDVYPLASLAVVLVAPLCIAPAAILAAYFTWGYRTTPRRS